MDTTKAPLVLESHPEIDWSDVEPLPQYEGKFPILNIQYNAKYLKLMDVFRRVIQNKEISERAFYLAEEVVRKMCGSYSAWYLRKVCLEQLNFSYEKELAFMNEIYDGNEKNYQIWEHRRFVTAKLNTPGKEIEFIDSILAKDNKNIHAWGYRKWLVEKFGLVEQDKKNLEYFFQEDIRNNSAWNFRYYLYKEGLNKENFHEELQYIFKSIKEVLDNEAVWNYLNGWFSTYNFECFGQKTDYAPPHLKKFQYADYPEVEQFVREVLKGEPSCRFALVTLANILVWKKEKQALQELLEVLDSLALQHDKIRFNYWTWYKLNVEKDLASIMKA